MKPIPQINVDITIDEQKFDRNVNDDLLINDNNIDECLEQQAALYAYYFILLQKATALKENASFNLDRLTNDAIQTAREELMDDSSKRITDKQIMAIVNSCPEVLEAHEQFLLFSKQRDDLYALVKSLEQKKDCLIAFAYKKRSEIEAMMSRNIPGSKIPKSGLEDE